MYGVKVMERCIYMYFVGEIYETVDIGIVRGMAGRHGRLREGEEEELLRRHSG